MTITKIYELLTPDERVRAGLLLVMILITAFLDMVSVASIMPFMAVLMNPEVVESNRWLALAYSRSGFVDHRDFLFFLGLFVAAALIVSIVFKALMQWALFHFSGMCAHSLACRLLKGYLSLPYTCFLNRNSADLGKSILSETGHVVGGILNPLMQLLAQGTVALFLIFLLVWADTVLAITVALVLGGTYSLVYLAIRHYLTGIGADRVMANRERFQVIQEALGGIKEVKIFGREKSFFSRFVQPSFRFAKHQVNNQIAGLMPRYVLEIVAFGGILLMALYLFKTHGDVNHVLPLLALYAFAGYRLLPALQQLYQHAVKIRFSQPALESLSRDINEYQHIEDEGQDAARLIPDKAIILKNITFRYPSAPAPALKSMNLEIPVRTAVGLVGSTGSGKTTSVDIILGLLRPETGGLLVDDTPIAPDNVRAWQRSLGYVPQQIYLADDTVAANIAFGIPPEEIDQAAVERAARIAALHQFVTNELPNGYQTMVGERGVRISGGQRQRIGIARALYHDPAVLIFDEATSALDNLTEKAVMSAINNLRRAKTIIIVAHRLTTVQHCDLIVLLEQGEIKASGTYEELLEKNERFREMVFNDNRQD